MGRRAWQATVHGVAKELDTTKDEDMCRHTPLLFLCSPTQNAMKNPHPSLKQLTLAGVLSCPSIYLCFCHCGPGG